jgi:hypothetical protein
MDEILLRHVSRVCQDDNKGKKNIKSIQNCHQLVDAVVVYMSPRHFRLGSCRRFLNPYFNEENDAAEEEWLPVLIISGFRVSWLQLAPR